MSTALKPPEKPEFDLPRNLAAKILMATGLIAMAFSLAYLTRLITISFIISPAQLMIGGIAGFICVGVSLIFL
jgi:hypothetical protein